jgi:chromosomal replication initiator protein
MNLESAKEIWGKALGELQIQVSKANYDTWLRDSQGISCQNDVFVVGVHNAFVAEWLTKRLYPLVRKTLANITGRDIGVQFVVRSQDQIQATSLAHASQTDGGVSTKVKVDKFNSRYTLNNFVVGNSNRFAYAAAMEVAENPGYAYNPLFIYGDAGQGKTHLLHAIGHIAASNGLRVIYTTAEQFTNEFILAIKQKQIEDFRGKFGNIHLLLFDDMQFISGKKQTQQCFFHIFNDLYNNNRQIIVTADCSPKDMNPLSSKLKSRLEWGLIVPIEPPDFETRLAILQAKAQEMVAPISDELLQPLAKQVHQNVRQLEGALIYLSAQAKMGGTDITPQMVNNLLTITNGKEGKKPIVRIVADYFNLSPEELIGKQRTKKIVSARQIAMYLIRQENGYSFTEIGKELGDRNHATILYGYKKITDELNINQQLRYQILEIKGKLNSDKASME